MLIRFAFVVILVCSFSITVRTEVLDRESQLYLVETFQRLTTHRNTLSSSQAATEQVPDAPLKCGTPVILSMYDNYQSLDVDLQQSLGVQIIQRPQNLISQYATPGGQVLIHYNASGGHAVFESNVDLNQNGTPDYVESVGRIADSVYDVTINVLGYTRPPFDDSCTDGGDGRIDIYLLSFGGFIFGQTWADTNCAVSAQVMPGWIEIDNDYQESSFTKYNERPLDAVRVTLAHEFFHMIHFSLDFTESRELYEMSSVWMEEEQYDDINDYYDFIPAFFRDPKVSLQSENVPVFGHPNASVVFLLYLSQNYGPGIIRAMWERAATLGIGSDWLQAVSESVDSASLGQKNLATSIQEFAVWNYFTGEYSDWAPDDIGYEEKSAYPVIPEAAMGVDSIYPFTVFFSNNSVNPQVNAATYLRFKDIPTIKTNYWKCDSSIVDTLFDTVCVDSTFDSLFSVFVGLDRPIQAVFGYTFIMQLAAIPDSHEVISLPPDTTDLFVELTNVDKFETITLIVTPTSTDPSVFSTVGVEAFGYGVLDTSIAKPFDSSIINLPTAFLVPYPNPLILSSSGTQYADSMTFQYDVPTDALGDITMAEVRFEIDIYTASGELVRNRTGIADVIPGDRQVGELIRTFGMGWDLRNQSGDMVASGIYLVSVQLFGKKQLSNSFRPFASDRTKVAIIK